MRDRLPVVLEDRELPRDKVDEINNDSNNNYGYVSIMYLISLIITLSSVLVLIFIRS